MLKLTCKAWCRRKASSDSASSSTLNLSTSSTSSTMPSLRWLLSFVVLFTVALADAQQLPPGPSLVQPSPYVLDSNRGPLKIECIVDYPEGDTDYGVDVTIEKSVWDANSKRYINKTICSGARSAVAGIECYKEYLADDEQAVKSLTATFAESSSPYSYYAGNYICERKARKKGMKAQSEHVKFQIIDCLTNTVTELSADGQRSDQQVDPLPVHLTKEEQTKQVTVVCAGRTLNPGDGANIKLFYQIDESTEPRLPQGSSIVEALSIVPGDANYGILAEERNVTVQTTLTFGVGDVGTWVVDCAMEQQPRCESYKTNKQIKIDVRIPKPIVHCPAKVTPEVVPESERTPSEGAPGKKPPVQYRAEIRCTIADGKPQDADTTPAVTWTWDDRDPATVPPEDQSAPVADPDISQGVSSTLPQVKGYAATLTISNVQPKHYRQYKMKVMTPGGPDGTEAELIGEAEVELTAGNLRTSPSSAAFRIGACFLLVVAAMLFQLSPSS